MEKKEASGGILAFREMAQWKTELLTAAFLLAVAVILNAGYTIKGLYMDDLYMMYCFVHQPFGEFVFPIGGTKCRFIYYIIAYLQLMALGNHMEWIVPMNIALNAGIAYSVYRMGRRFSGNRYVGLACGFLFQLSRMSYYQVTQFWGVMESLGLWAAIGILYCLFRWLNDSSEDRVHFWMANALYFTVCFVHERYMVLLPLIFLALFVKKNRNRWDWLLPTGLFLLVQGIRYYAIGSLIPAGTGGTNVTDTFQIHDVFTMAFQQVFYLFGINTGGEWLCGVTWQNTARWAKIFVLLSILMLAILVGAFVYRIVKDQKERKSYLVNAMFFILFIGLCIGCSSVTIRVEVRWVYVSMTAAWLFAAYMYGVISGIYSRNGQEIREKGAMAGILPDYRRALFAGGVLLGYLVLVFPVELYYRSYYDKLYFWPGQSRNNSLAEETYGRYGEDLFEKKVYILKNSYGFTEFNADGFFKSFDKNHRAEGPEVIVIDDIRDVGQVTDNMIILSEDTREDAYQDVTDLVRDLKCHSLYGYYGDGWMDEKAAVRVMAGADGIIDLQFLYPGEITGTETCAIKVNGAPGKLVKIDSSMVYAQIQTEPHQTVELSFENNFFLKDAQEKRGETRFSMIMNVTTR